MASQTVPFGIGFKLDGTLGATTIGLVAASIMYGVTCVQTYTYYHRENNDTKLLRGLVGILWVIDSLHLALILHFVYYFTVTNYFKPLALLDAPWSVGAEVVITTINDVIIRLLFAHRIWLLSKNKIITFIVVGLSIFVAAIGFALAARIDQLRAFLDLGKISWLIYLVFGGIASVDTLIATILCVLLNKLRTGHKRTDTQIQRLIVYSIHTGALTSLLAIICVICFATLPKNFVFIAVFFTLPKFFLNSLLATLNAREEIRHKLQEKTVIPMHVQVSGSVRESALPPPSSLASTNDYSKAPTLVEHHEEAVMDIAASSRYAF